MSKQDYKITIVWNAVDGGSTVDSFVIKAYNLRTATQIAVSAAEDFNASSITVECPS